MHIKRGDQIRSEPWGLIICSKLLRKYQLVLLTKKILALLVQNDFLDKVIKVNFRTCLNLCSLEIIMEADDQAHRI